MANYATLISAIQTTIAANGNNEITGPILQQTLLAIVNSLGANYQFVGVANESTNPGTPDQNVVYIAGSGTYPNFNSAVVPSGYLGVFKYNGSWVVQTVAVGKDYDEAITALQKNKVDKRAGKNLFDPNADDIVEYHYISSAGSTPTSETSNISGYIPVTAQVDYHLSASNDGSVGSYYRAFYDSNKTLLSVQFQNTNDFTTPPNCAFVRFTYRRNATEIMLETGSERTEYLEYNVIGGYINGLIDNVYSLQKNKVDISVGKNLFNPNAPDISVGRYLSSDGSQITATGMNISGFIPVQANTIYHLSAANDVVVGKNYRGFYDSDKNLLSTQYQETAATKVTFTTPANCAFIRFTYYTSITEIMLELGGVRTSYYPYSPIGGYEIPLIDGIEELKTKKVDVKVGKNLWDGKILVTGYYLNDAGVEKRNSNIDISDYVPVQAETDYCLSANGNVGVTLSSSMYLCYYDANKTFLSSRSTYNKTFTTPVGCAYIRFSILMTRTLIQLEYGSTRTAYQEYSPIGGYYAALQNGQVEYDNLSDGVKALIGSSVLRFDSLRGSGTLAPGASLTLANQYVKKNVSFVAHIDGTVESIVIGVGGTALTAYLGYYITITPTNITLKRMDTGSTPATAAHGLTLTEHTTVIVDTQILPPSSVINDDVLQVNITLCDNLGNTFVLNANNYWGYGTPFITNNNTTDSVDVNLSFFPKDESKNIWVFGDSYCEFTYLQKRLSYWLFLNGYNNWLLCAKGGMDQADQLPVLQNLLNLGFKPAFVVWLLGMNDGNDTVSGETITVNSTAKTNLDAFLALCANYDITPILATIPTVPTRQHTGLSNYVKSLGKRFIDIAKAVGCDTSGNWYTGLLSSDGIHPTSAGSKVIFEQILIDFPEITVN
ncbi:MAG: SGNH/GDSL hydrolase family protein [Alphaproteobacteria bacterium]|nr:SGNH/GDSL hydrolase family protein [Alphaproteobacteria bacterium]